MRCFHLLFHTGLRQPLCRALCSVRMPYLLSRLFQIFVHPHFQRRNEEAVLVLGHMVNVGLAHDKDFDSERISFDLYLFQLHHLLSDKSRFRQSMSFTALSSARSRQPSG